MTAYRMERLFPADMAARLAAQPVLVLPIGTLEWHSHHLPLGLDGLVAQGVCDRIADMCDAVLAPTTYWAVGGVPFPYTLDLPGELVEPLLASVFAQFGAMGFRVLVAFTGHFGLNHTLALKRAAWTAMQTSGVTVLPLTEYDPVTDLYQGDHAGPGETSLLWALEPGLVRLDAVPAGAPLEGVIGEDPRGRASRAEGESLCDAIATRTAAAVTAMLAAPATARTEYIAAIYAAVRVLEALHGLRATLPKAAVPPLQTPAYLAHCQALMAGDFVSAREHAERKLADLTA